MAQFLAADKRNLEAIDYFEKAIREEPDFYIPYLGLLDVLQALNHPSLEVWLERAVQALPRSPQIAWYYSQYLMHAGRIEELAQLKWLDKIKIPRERFDVIGRLSEIPDRIAESKLYRSVAKIYLHGDEKELAWAVNEITKARPDWNLCEFAKLLLHPIVELGKIELIPQVYQRICGHCRTNENGVAGHLETVQARAFINLNRYPEAVQKCEAVLENDPDHIDTLDAYWWCLDEVGKLDQSIKVANKLATIKPGYENIYYNLGYLCGKNGQLGKAQYYYDRQIQIEEDHYLALENISFLYLQMADFQKATDAFESFIQEKAGQFLELAEGDLDKGNRQFVFASEVYILQAKIEKFKTLLDYAKSIQGSSTYAYQLQKRNCSSEPLIGSEIALGKKAIHN